MPGTYVYNVRAIPTPQLRMIHSRPTTTTTLHSNNISANRTRRRNSRFSPRHSPEVVVVLARSAAHT